MQPELTRFLLGQLPETEQHRIEDRAFADPGFLSEIEAAEADLIDAYVQGGLTPSDRRAFEQLFFTSPQRRRKVAFARDLAALSAEHKSASVPTGIREWFQPLRFALAAAALLIVGAALWLAREDTSMRKQIASLQNERTQLTAREQDLRRKLAEAQAPFIATLVLLPGVSRAQSNIAQFNVPQTAQYVRIEVQLDPRDNYPSFRAELSTRRGQSILSAQNLQPRRAANALAVHLMIPADALAPGQYEVRLSGIAAPGAALDIGFYYFEIHKQ